MGGPVLYGSEIEHHYGDLALVSIATAGTCTACAMLLASVCSTTEAASGLATDGALSRMRTQLGKFTIVHGAMEGFDQVLGLDASFRERWPTRGVLTATAAGVMGRAVWRLNRSNVFG